LLGWWPNFSYPQPVQRYEVRSQGRQPFMVYMDVASPRPSGKTIVLLHGKNFCGATWQRAIEPLREAGYRVVVPDQIGLCKSSKPQA
jgi:pimeloyl-ACP methyl ester carboxylesterase